MRPVASAALVASYYRKLRGRSEAVWHVLVHPGASIFVEGTYIGKLEAESSQSSVLLLV